MHPCTLSGNPDIQHPLTPLKHGSSALRASVPSPSMRISASSQSGMPEAAQDLRPPPGNTGAYSDHLVSKIDCTSCRARQMQRVTSEREIPKLKISRQLCGLRAQAQNSHAGPSSRCRVDMGGPCTFAARTCAPAKDPSKSSRQWLPRSTSTTPTTHWHRLVVRAGLGLCGLHASKFDEWRQHATSKGASKRRRAWRLPRQ